MFSECYKDIGISFLVDTSSLVGSDGFGKSKQFLSSVIQYFNIATTKVSIASFAEQSSLGLPFDQATSFEYIISHIEKMTYSGNQGHSVSKGFQHAFTQLNGIDAKSKFVVLVTSSETDDSSEFNKIRNLKRSSSNEGTIVLVVSVGNSPSENKLKTITSTENMFMVNSYDDIIGSVVKLRELLCKIARR